MLSNLHKKVQLKREVPLDFPRKLPLRLHMLKLEFSGLITLQEDDHETKPIHRDANRRNVARG